MKRKPGMLLILMITLFLTIGFQCDEPSYVAIRDIAGIDIVDRTTNQVLLPPVSTSSDSLSLLVALELEDFVSNNLAFDLMNSAWADCPDGNSCMANEIVDIRVFCDKPIYNVSAGTNLAGLLTYIAEGWTDETLLPEFLEQLPGKDEGYTYHNLERLTMNLNLKPPPDHYTFSVEIEDNNGHIFRATAPTIEWL
jgi:hypothetical protein